MLTPDQIETLLQVNGFENLGGIDLIKHHNHTYRLQIGVAEAYLKIYTKDWYGDDAAGTGYCVEHETAAWQALARHGLAIPQILLADTTTQNALSRPYLMTKRLPGHSLTELLMSAVSSEIRHLLLAVGRYMSAMHKITFPYAGYITSTSPNAPLDPNHIPSGPLSNLSETPCKPGPLIAQQRPDLL